MKIKSIAIGVIIAIIFVMFCAYGTKLVYEEPKYEDYCKFDFGKEPIKIPGLNSSCNDNSPALEDLRTKCYQDNGVPINSYDEKGCVKEISCDYCNKEFNAVEEKYSRNLFLISLIFGVIVIILSAFLIDVGSVSGGLMFGSLMFIIYGTGRYWMYMNRWLQFIILGVALIILIFVGYKVAKKGE